MPSWLHSDSQEVKDYETIQNIPDQPEEKHKAHFSHEFLASAAAGFAAHKLEERQEKVSGEPGKHKLLIESASALAAGFITHIAETKGRDFIDEKHKKKLEEQAKAKTVETIDVSEHAEWKDVKSS